MASSMYKNKESMVLESSHIRAEFLPDPGGKMVSFINKKTGYEFLVQRPNPVYRDQPFGGIYVDGECSGFDEMFPTIDATTYGNIPWKGTVMHDHGEVWSLPWECSLVNGKLWMSVDGINFPYTLKKEIYFIRDNVLRINYTLINDSKYVFEFLWAAHIMLNLQEGTRIVVPDDCRKMITVLTNSGREYGQVNDWPFLSESDNTFFRADTSRPEDTKGFEKYYFENKLNDGWCEIQYPDQVNTLKVSFSSDTVPYLGLLMNEGGWDNLYNIIVEPCTVCYDRPDKAKEHGQLSEVAASGSYNWYMDLEA